MAEATFFDIDHILAEEEKVFVKVTTTCFNMDGMEYGIINLRASKAQKGPQTQTAVFGPESAQNPKIDQNQDLGNPNDTSNMLGKRIRGLNDLEQGNSLELPFWLSRALNAHKLCVITPPKWFGRSFKQIVLADPEITNLKEKSNYFYELGYKLAESMDYDKDSVIFELLQKVFFERMKKLMNLVVHLKESKNHGFLTKLTISEENIYKRARKGFRGIKMLQGEGKKVPDGRRAKRKLILRNIKPDEK